jgi:6-phosphogluconate dehydrogenase
MVPTPLRGNGGAKIGLGMPDSAYGGTIMEIGLVGLGRMGLNTAVRLLRAGHTVVGTARSPEPRAALEKAGGRCAANVAALAAELAPPRVIWLLVPAGPIVDHVIGELLPGLAPGDLVVDGGNSNYHDSIRRSVTLKEKHVGFLDCGTSGGIWGLEEGYCLMVGGDREHVARVEPVLRALAPPDGWLHAGPSGAGHFVKMVHNGIEYGLLQAYGEGFELLARSPLGIDLHAVAKVWNHGSVVRSWLLELAERALEKDGRLESIRGYVEDSGMGRWTVQEAMDRDVPAPVLALSLLMRFASRQDESFSARLIAALRNEFGGHAVKPAEPGS